MVSGKTEDSETEGKGAQTSRAEVGRDSRKRRSRSGTAETTDHAEEGCSEKAGIHPEKRAMRVTAWGGKDREDVNQEEIGKACAVKECEKGVTEQGQRQRQEEQGKLGGADVPTQKRGRGRPRKIQPATQAVSQSADTSPQVAKILSGATEDDNTHTHTHTHTVCVCVNE